MKYRHLFWALIMIAIGLLFLFSNFGWLDFHWISIWRLWPLVLIFWGIAILPLKDWIKFGLVILTLAITFLFFNRITEPRWCFSFGDHSWSWDKDRDSEGDSNWDTWSDSSPFSTQILSVPLDSIPIKAVLKMEAAAGKFTIDGETSDLLQFKKEGDVGNYSLTTENEAGKKLINIRMDKHKKIRRINKNTVNIQLNTRNSWDLDFDIGAASVNMDLSLYKIDTAKIDAGAASVELKLGNLNPQTVVFYNAGASSLEIQVPITSACEIHSDSFLVSRDFEGFHKTGDGIYQTDRFPEGSNQIIIHIETAISSLKVERY